MVSHSSPHWVSFPPLRDYSITLSLLGNIPSPPQGGVTDTGNNYSQLIRSLTYYLFFCTFLTKACRFFHQQLHQGTLLTTVTDPFPLRNTTSFYQCLFHLQLGKTGRSQLQKKQLRLLKSSTSYFQVQGFPELKYVL